MRTRLALAAALLLLALAAPRASAAELITIEDDDAAVDFPGALTFSAHVRASYDLREVVLEYGVEQRTCGDVSALTFLSFDPGETADVSWTWDMRQSGSIPPGATVWYRWHVTDKRGVTVDSPRRTVTWLDRVHRWRELGRPGVSLHWYEGDDAFATALAESASASLARLEKEIGFTPERPIDLYIYASSDDMREAVLYEPGWTGGQAFAEQNLTIIGIAPDDLAWGKRTAAHELTHVLVGNRAFSCFANIPTWLDEGIAVYGEGGLEPAAEETLRQAIADDTLLSVRTLSGAFSEDSATADLSYSESYSIVSYLIDAQGKDKLIQLFTELAAGGRAEAAVRKVYGFGLDGLEDRWRASVGARPRAGAGEEAAQTPAPPIPTLAPAESPAAPDQPAPAREIVPGARRNLTLLLAITLTVVGVLGLTFTIARRPRP